MHNGRRTTAGSLPEHGEGAAGRSDRYDTFRRSTIEILRVSGSSRPNSVAGAIAALLRNEGEVEVQAIGPHAVNQAVKAIAIARSYIEAEGLDLRTVPSFVKLELQNEERTAVRFAVESMELAKP